MNAKQPLSTLNVSTVLTPTNNIKGVKLCSAGLATLAVQFLDNHKQDLEFETVLEVVTHSTRVARHEFFFDRFGLDMDLEN